MQPHKRALEWHYVHGGTHMIFSKMILAMATPLLILSSGASCPHSEPEIYMEGPVEVTGPLLTMSAEDMQSKRELQFGKPTFGKEIAMGYTEVTTEAGHSVDYEYTQIGDSDSYCVTIKNVNLQVKLGLTVYLNPLYP